MRWWLIITAFANALPVTGARRCEWRATNEASGNGILENIPSVTNGTMRSTSLLLGTGYDRETTKVLLTRQISTETGRKQTES